MCQITIKAKGWMLFQSTVCAMDLDKINLAMVVWFEAQTNFSYLKICSCFQSVQKWPQNNYLATFTKVKSKSLRNAVKKDHFKFENVVIDTLTRVFLMCIKCNTRMEVSWRPLFVCFMRSNLSLSLILGTFVTPVNLIIIWEDHIQTCPAVLSWSDTHIHI